MANAAAAKPMWTMEFISDHEAHYRKNELRCYAENSCVLALPGLLPESEVYRAIGHIPAVRDAEFFSLPAYVRRDAASDVRELCVPEANLVRCFELLQSSLRRSYSHRHPGNKATMAFLMSLAAVDAEAVDMHNYQYLPRLSPSGGGSLGLLIVGPPGGGKTTLLDRFRRRISEDGIFFHRVLNGNSYLWPQIPVLVVEVPETKTPKAFCIGIYGQVDAIAHTRLCSTLPDRRNPGYFLVRAAQLLSSYMVGLLVVEDLQHLATARGDCIPLLNWLGALMEVTGIPIVIAATFKVNQIIQSGSGIGSKLTSGGKQTIDYVQGLEYKQLLTASWKLRVSHPDANLPIQLPYIAAKYTAGNRRFTREYLEALFIEMSHCDRKPITLSLMNAVAEKTMVQRCPLIAAVHKWKNGLPLSPTEKTRYSEYIDIEVLGKWT